MNIVFFVVYILAGCILSIPYTLLANGNLENLLITSWIAPAAAFFLFIVYQLRGIGRKDGKLPRWGGAFFWIMAAYFCLPIIFNGISILLRWSGYSVLGDIVFSTRYLSLLVLLIALLIALIIFGAASDFWKSFSGTDAPPNPPEQPSPPSLQKPGRPEESHSDKILHLATN